MNNDLIKRSDVERMLTALGGCDASDKEAAGWDKAIDAAIIGLEELDSANEWIVDTIENIIKHFSECQNDAIEKWKEYREGESLGIMIAFNQLMGFIVDELLGRHKEN